MKVQDFIFKGQCSILKEGSYHATSPSNIALVK